METLKLSIWQLLVQAMTLTSVAGLIALVASLLLARSLTSLMSVAQTNAALARRRLDKTLRGTDELFTTARAGGAYYE